MRIQKLFILQIQIILQELILTKMNLIVLLKSSKRVLVILDEAYFEYAAHVYDYPDSMNIDMIML